MPDYYRFCPLPTDTTTVATSNYYTIYVADFHKPPFFWNNPTWDFWNDPAEDIYTLDDGEPI